MTDCPVLTFTVEGAPRVKARPRVVLRQTKRGMRRVVYTPRETVDWEAVVRGAAGRTLEGLALLGWTWDLAPADFELSVNVWRARAVGDLDNYVKALADALQGVLWSDDRYVVAHWATMGVDARRPRLEVRVRRFPRGTYAIAGHRP